MAAAEGTESEHFAALLLGPVKLFFFFFKSAQIIIYCCFFFFFLFKEKSIKFEMFLLPWNRF